MAAGGPAGPLRQTRRVIGIADEDSAAGFLLLEVTLQAQRLVALVEHSCVHRTVRRVTAYTTFLECLMLKDEWTSLRHVTLETGLVLPEQQCSAAFDLLRQTCSAAFDRAADVRVVTIGATHLALQHRVMVWHFKSRAHFKVTLEAGVRRSSRIDDLALIATG